MIRIAWLWLSAAIVAEVSATLALNAVSEGVYPWVVVVILGYATTFYLLGKVLAMGTPIGVVYGIWAAGGVMLTAVLGAVIFHEVLTPRMWLGFACICVGVYLAETGSAETLTR